MAGHRFSVRQSAVILCCLAALALVIGVGFYLNDTHAAARDRVHHDFADRSKLAADLAGNTLTASDATNRPDAEMSYAGPAAALRDTIEGLHDGIAWAIVLRHDGSLVAADPPSMTARAAELAAGSQFAQAVRTDRLTLGDLIVDPTGPVLPVLQPFRGVDGSRVLVLPAPIEQVASVMSSAFDITASHAYVVDGRDTVIVSSDGEAAGQPLPRPVPGGATGSQWQGVVDGDYYVSNPVPGSMWRVVIVTPEEKLLAPLQAPERAAWRLFAAFAAAIVLLVVIGVVAVVSLFRLAHARAHDTLTGLPTRALFVDRIEAVIAERRRRPGELTAALFIDLDGFKPINDRYGHATGDSLLRGVAERLRESMRPDDYVSRFGGDEFIILCRHLVTEADAHAVADRIRRYVAEPFEIDGHRLHVGTSIGIALVDDLTDDAMTLIHHADLAMYEAKRNGKGCIVQFTPDLASA
ncbi:diguanylate cyclase domain-containing protein [Actinoplanes philippinensis]|uniref:diguanylate cyclase domain-containing protein n=1 Tax=Actinoplanes philippinensis TaxID=35752 RepID=UPI0033F06A46